MIELGQKFDKYQVVRKLGEGGMSVVYEAINPFGVSVVLKMLHPELVGHDDVVERFRREGKIQFTLRHPNIVRVTDMVEHDGLPALVADFMVGEDLEAALSSGHRFDMPDTFKIATKVLDALQTAHANGFVHRDIKPSNIFLEATDYGFEPRLMDFGIAKIQAAAALTRAQEFCGTPAYTSPEQIQSTKDVDGKTDVYAMGVVLWQLLSGQEPYADKKNDPYAVLAAVVRETLPPLPSDVPQWLASIVARATEKDPEKRYPTAESFREALLNAANQSDTLATTMLVPDQATGDYLEASGPHPKTGPSSAVEGRRDELDSLNPTPVDDMSGAGIVQRAAKRALKRGAKKAGAESAPAPKRTEHAASYSTRAADHADDAASRARQRSEADELAQLAFAETRPDSAEHVRAAMDAVRAEQDGEESAPDAERSDLDIHKITAAIEAEEAELATPRRRLTPLAPLEPQPSGLSLTEERPYEDRMRPAREREPRSFLERHGNTVVACAILLGIAAGAYGFYYLSNQPVNAPSGFARVEPGTHVIGSPDGELGRGPDETRHEVEITRPFAIAHTEVTRGQWIELMHSQPQAFPECGDSCPIANVSWLDAIEFANRMSADSNRDPCYVISGAGRERTVTWPEGLDCSGWRLPTEAEWEVAARAGTESALPNGDLQFLERDLIDPRVHEMGWYGANSHADYQGASDCRSWSENHERCGIQPVTQKRPNGFGLYDMHGNVAEWVWDRYGPYPTERSVDPLGPDEGSQRVIRGGAWNSPAADTRSAARSGSAPVGRLHVGIRVVRTLRR